MNPFIYLHLSASRKPCLPDAGASCPIRTGTRVKDIPVHLNIPLEKADLFFVNSLKTDLDTLPEGEKQVGVFPPAGGG